jgi:hypothetical protein
MILGKESAVSFVNAKRNIAGRRPPKKTRSKAAGAKMRLAEREGFEPPEVLPSTVFKTAAIDRSAISPGAKLGGHTHIFVFLPKFLV